MQYDMRQIDFKVANSKKLNYCPGCTEVVARPKYWAKTHTGECQTTDKHQIDDKFQFDIFAKGKRLQYWPCPTCKMPIEKTEGCSKMECPNCRNYFCWICKQTLDYSDPYKHYDLKE